MNEETGIFNYLKNYVDKNKTDEKAIANGSVLESPSMIGYFEAKEILALEDTINKAIEYIKQEMVLEFYNDKLPLEIIIDKLLSILGDK